MNKKFLINVIEEITYMIENNTMTEDVMQVMYNKLNSAKTYLYCNSEDSNYIKD